jgi:hypothetical protein
MLEIIQFELLRLTAFMLAALFFQVGNIFAGAYYNRDHFSWKVFFGGFKGVAIMYILFVWLTTGVTMLPWILTYFRIVSLDQSLVSVVTGTGIAIYWGAYTIERAKDMSQKLMDIRDYKPYPEDERPTIEGEG